MSILRIGHKLQQSELLIKRLGTDILKAVFTPVETQTAVFAEKHCLFFVGTFEGKSNFNNLQIIVHSCTHVQSHRSLSAFLLLLRLFLQVVMISY